MTEVRIDPAVWAALGHDIHRGIYLVKQLREAGVPVVGSIWPIGVEHGSLHMATDPVFDELVWTWSDK